jgi:hypothetical protein
MIQQSDGRRFERAAEEVVDLREALERAEAAERRERWRRVQAEATAAELAQIVACEVAARTHAEKVADELQALVDGRRLMQAAAHTR